MALVFGRDAAESSLPPARMAHSDYSVTGLRSSVRYCRKDICEKASEALEAEDEKSALIPRYAAYSVWRPIKPVKKDPIALCDWRTIDKQNESTTIEYRATSGVTENGEYIIQGLIGLPPKHPIKQKWYVEILRCPRGAAQPLTVLVVCVGIGCRSRNPTRWRLSSLRILLVTPTKTSLRAACT